MKLLKFFIVAIALCFVSKTPAQYLDPDRDLKFSAEKLNNRGIQGNSSLSLDGNEIIGEYDGNLQVIHTINYPLPNNLDLNYTLTYNANVEHRVFNSFMNVVPYYPYDGYMINAPEWIIGLNGFAIQTLNFENNFYMCDNNGYTEGLNGEECPLLIPGYHYTNRLTQYFYNLTSDYKIGKDGFDYIDILMADGSKKTLSNVRYINDDISSRIGTYVEPGLDGGNSGYAIVEYLDSKTELRRMWYKPGDGLTYYFEEKVSDLNFYVGQQYSPHPNQVKRMRLLKIIASNDAYVGLSYSSSVPYEFASAGYIGGSTYITDVIGFGFDIDNDYIKKIFMNNKSGVDGFAGSILNYNHGTDLYSTLRSGENFNSKIKYIEKITDGIGRENNINYVPYNNREYRYIGSENDFNFTHPIYLIDEIDYYSGKKSIFEFYNEPFDCGPDFEPINFGIGTSNTCNLEYANRDNQTNYMIKTKSVSNKFNGIYEPLYSETYTYYKTPPGIPSYYDAYTNNIMTNIAKDNLVQSDTSSPLEITRTLNFTEFNILNYKFSGYQGAIGVFEPLPFQAAPKRGKTIKLVEETIQSGNEVFKKTNTYSWSKPRAMNYVEGTIDLLKTEESVNNNSVKKTTTFTNNYQQKFRSQNGTFSGPFTSCKNIIKNIVQIDPNNVISEKNYQLEFFEFENSNTASFYSTKSLEYDKSYEGSSIKLYKKYNYNYSSLNGGYGKLKSIENIDPLDLNRKNKIEYNYEEQPFRLGSLKSITNDNGLVKEYYYPDDNGILHSPCTWVKYDGTMASFEDYHLFDIYHANSYPYKIKTILNSVTLTTYQGIQQPFNHTYLVDENGYVSEYIFDYAGRVVNVNLPGSFTELPTEWDPPPPSNNSKIYYYNEDPNHIAETVRFNNDPAQMSNMVTLSEFDGLGNLKEFSVETNENYELKQSKKYNFLGLVSEEADGSGITTRYKYDFLGRPLIRHYNDNTKDKYEYFAFGGTIDGIAYYEKTKFTDAAGKVKETYYDLSGNVVAEKSGTNNATIFNFNSINQLSSYKSPTGKITSFQYDGFGNIKQKISPDAGTINYKYDKWGNLRFSLNPAAPLTAKELTFNKYDQLGRLVITGLLAANYGFDVLDPDLDYSTVQAGKGPFENYITNTGNFVLVNMYDDYTRTGVFANLPNFAAGTLQNLKGKLVATAFRDNTTNALSYKVYSYDYLGRVKDEYVFFQSTSLYKKITNEYDKLNNLVKQNMDNQFYTWYEYDKLNRLKTVKSNRADANPILEAAYKYSSSDKIISSELGTMGSTAPKLNYSYDNKGRIYDINGIATDVFTTVFRQTLTYFNNDNISTMWVKNNGSGSWSDLNFSYGYDDLNRLTSTSCNYTVYNEAYNYDYDGNFINKSKPNNTSQSLSYTYGISGTNKLTRLTKGTSTNYDFQYDHNGNLKTDPRKSFTSITYDRRNLVYYTYVNSVLKYGFFYDDAGNRISKKQLSPTVQEYYLRDHTGRELAVYDWVTGKLKLVNLYGNGLIGKVNVSYDAQNNRTDTRQYYFKDHLGSIRMIIDGGSFDIAGAQDYYPYGEILRQYTTGSNVNDKYKFTEKERDTETNYDYFGARYYDSQIGRWLQVDPLSDIYPGWSPYNYTLNNPLRFIDPKGMAAVDVYPDDPEDKKKQQSTFQYLQRVSKYGEKVVNLFSNEISSSAKKVEENLSEGTETVVNTVLNDGPKFLNKVSENVMYAGIVASIATTAYGQPEIGAAIIGTASSTSLKLDLTALGLSVINYNLNSSNNNYDKLLYQANNVLIGGGIGVGATKFANDTGQLVRYIYDLSRYLIIK